MGLTQPSVQWVPRTVQSVYSGKAVKLFTAIISFLDQECKEFYLQVAFSLHIIETLWSLSLSGSSRCDENELVLRIKAVDQMQRKPVTYHRSYMAVFFG